MIVALSKDFLLAFSQVQKSHQKKVREFFETFQTHPEATGLHYEPIQSVRDKNFYSVRIDQAYRAVVARPEPNLYVLLWVDHHDEAYRWAERTQLKVHPATGALQVVEVGAVAEELTASTRAAPEQAGGLFAHVKDTHLVQLGVPEELLPAVRAMHTDADLEGAEALLPQEAYEALFMLASGDTLDEVFRDLEKSQDGQARVDTSDFQRALENDDSQRRFYVVEGAQELAEILATQGFRSEVIYDDENDCWRGAMDLAPAESGLPVSFYRIEWENVVQAQNITTLDEYLVAPRIGRGTRLSREMKRKVWAVFQEYRAELNQNRKKEYVDLIRDARQLLEHKGLKLPYRAVIVDEAQDMSAEALRPIRALVPPGQNDMFIVGDAHQRIYRHRVSLGQCGIDIRGRGKKLKVNYRTTDEIRRFAVQLLEGRAIDDLDGGQDDQPGYMSLTHGEPPAVHTLSCVADEIAYVQQCIAGLQSDGAALKSICVVARTKRLLELYAGNLWAAGFEVYEIKRDSAEQRDRPGIRLATMHRVKGLEFDHVIVVAANKAIVPLDAALASADDRVTKGHLETGERALLYVALTRAKKSALITASGEVSPYLATSGLPFGTAP